MESYPNNRLVRKYFNCTKCKEYDAKLINPFANHIYCSKCGSLVIEIPESKYKKLKKKIGPNIEIKNEEDKKIPYKLKDNILKNNYHFDKREEKKVKKQKKDKNHNMNNNYNNNYHRNQSSSHYSNMNMNFYNDNSNNYNNNYRNNNRNNINRINIDDSDNSNNINNEFNYYNNESEQHRQPRHKNNSRRGHSVNNPHPHMNNNNSNNFFSNFFSDSDFQPFSDFDFPNFSPFRITIRRQPISNDIFDPMFSSFGSFFDGFFQDNFSSNFRSNIAGDFFSQILQILERNQAEANKNKHPPASDNALKKLKKFNMNEKYCKKDGKGKYELPNCCICLTEIQKGEKTVLLPCGHMFHWKCCLTWLKKNNTCPMCRFEIK